MSVLGLVSGAFGGLGVLVLLQQFAVLYPTRIATIVAVLGGAVIGLGAPLVASRTARGRDTTSSPTVGVVATHVAPDPGLQAWSEPDPTQPVLREIPGGERLRVIEQRGEWANVETADGWTGWVDARLLEPVGS
jgi:hypothetical protein